MPVELRYCFDTPEHELRDLEVDLTHYAMK